MSVKLNAMTPPTPISPGQPAEVQTQKNSLHRCRASRQVVHREARLGVGIQVDGTKFDFLRDAEVALRQSFQHNRDENALARSTASPSAASPIAAAASTPDLTDATAVAAAAAAATGCTVSIFVVGVGSVNDGDRNSAYAPEAGESGAEWGEGP